MLPQIVVFQCFPAWLSHDGKGRSESVSQCTGQGYQGWPARKEGGVSSLSWRQLFVNLITQISIPGEEEEERRVEFTKQSRWSEL